MKTAKTIKRDAKSDFYSGSNRSTSLNCVCINLDKENEKEGKELADKIVEFGWVELLTRNFLNNFYYRLEEMRYIAHLGSLDGISCKDWSTLNKCEELATQGDDLICKWYVGIDFNWEKKRYYTTKEIDRRNKSMLRIMKNFKPSTS